MPLLPTVGDLEPELHLPRLGPPLPARRRPVLPGVLAARRRPVRAAAAARPGRARPDRGAAAARPARHRPAGHPRRDGVRHGRRRRCPGRRRSDAAFAPLGLAPAPGVDVAALRGARRLRRLPGARTADHRRAAHPDRISGQGTDVRHVRPRPRPGRRRRGLAVRRRRRPGRARNGLDPAQEGPGQGPGAAARPAGRASRPPEVDRWRNRWTIGDRQLRYGRDGRWYPFAERGGRGGPPARRSATRRRCSTDAGIRRG